MQKSMPKVWTETTAQFRSGTIALEQKGKDLAQTIAEKSATIEKQLRSPVDLIWQKLQLIAADNSPTAGYSKAFAKAVSNKKK
jgi:Zn-dependent oligopeptidase